MFCKFLKFLAISKMHYLVVSALKKKILNTHKIILENRLCPFYSQFKVKCLILEDYNENFINKAFYY